MTTNEKGPDMGPLSTAELFGYQLPMIQSLLASVSGGRFSECDVGCACLALSSVDQILLRKRKEQFEERCRSGQAGTSTQLATLDRESRELHHLLLLNAQGAPIHATQ